eukprot:g8701.t1
MSKYNNGAGGNGGGHAKENGHPKDNVFDLDSAIYASDEFRMHEFKVKRCPRARPHDWTQCPFAHPGEKARRRDPRRYKYSGTACPEFRKSGCCRRGDACPFAHGVFECWLHPSRYRTQLCTDGNACRRRVCFFAHVESELRHPEDDPAVAQKQVQAELAAEVQTLQQQHLTQALQALLLQTTNSLHNNPSDRQSNSGHVLSADLLKQSPVTTPMGGVGANHALPNSVDHGNPATALQLALLQQLQQSGGDKTGATAGQVQSAFEGMGLTQTDPQSNRSGGGGVPLTDVYSAFNQLQQLMSDSSTTAATVTSSPQSNGVNDGVTNAANGAAILTQMMTGNGSTTPPPTSVGEVQNNSLLLSSLLSQNATKMSMANGNGNSVRHSIDNSYLHSLNAADTNAAAAAAAAMAAANQYSSAGFPAVLQNGTLLQNGNSMLTAQDMNIPTSMSTVVPVSGPPNMPMDSMYSMESIQLLLQNPAFSSNLSQLFQMNPGLLQQLTNNPNDSANHGRHSIDNAYLGQLNTDINHFVNNGGVKNGTESQMVGNGIAPSQQEALMMASDLFSQQNGSTNGYSNNLTVSEALIQGLNALKMQIEGTPPLSAAPFTVQATIPNDNGQGSASHLSVLSSNNSSSENAYQASSDTSGDAGNFDPVNSTNIATADPQVESSD